MGNNKKGFTLIELLAVIVVLAVLALITVPIISNIIGNIKDQSILRSAEGYLDSVEQAIVQNMTVNPGYIPKSCEIVDTGIKCNGQDAIIPVEVSGMKPLNGGTITFENGKIKEINLSFEAKVVVKDETGKLVFVNLEGDDKVLQEAKSLIAAIDDAIAKEKEQNSEFNPETCILMGGNNIECRYYEIIYNEYDEEEWIPFSKELKIDLNLKKEVSGSFEVKDGKVSATLDIMIDDNTFIKYPNDEIFLAPALTEEYALSQANKYIAAVRKAVANFIESSPQTRTFRVELRRDYVNFKNGEEWYNIGSADLEIEGIRPFIDELLMIEVKDGELDLTSGYYYFRFGNFVYEPNEEGVLSVPMYSVECNLGIDSIECPTSVKRGSSLSIDLKGKNIPREYLSVFYLTSWGDQNEIDFAYDNEVIYIEFITSDIRIVGPQDVDVVYNNIDASSYPATVKQGNTLTVDFSGSGLDVSKIVPFYDSGKASNYSVQGNVLTVNNVSSDISIMYFDNICVSVDEITRTVFYFDEWDEESSIYGIIANQRDDYASVKYKPGDEYICAVNDTTYHHFFVLSTSNASDEIINNSTSDKTVSKINLILDRNICEDGTLVNDENYCVYQYNSSGSLQDGPVVAMQKLNNATSSWKSELTLNKTYNDEGGKFTSFALTGKARLHKQSEIHSSYVWDSYNFLSINNGEYWSLSTSSLASRDFDYESEYPMYISATDYYGLRPVIEVTPQMIKP